MTSDTAALGPRRAHATTARPLVELLSVAHCPNADSVRRRLHHALADAGTLDDIVELVGDYPSPTVLVDGLDVVTGRQLTPGACCRLDLPTTDQIREALVSRRSRRSPSASGTPREAAR